MDAHVSASSTWPGVIDELSTTVPVPLSEMASLREGVYPFGEQTIHSIGLFTQQPKGTYVLPPPSFSLYPSSDVSEFADSWRLLYGMGSNRSSFSLLIKSALLLRKVNTFLRLSDAMDLHDPTATTEFRALDSLISTFRCVPLPSSTHSFISSIRKDYQETDEVCAFLVWWE